MVRFDTPAKPRPLILGPPSPTLTPVFRFTIIKIPFHGETSSETDSTQSNCIHDVHEHQNQQQKFDINVAHRLE
ncbi:unnamed protein product [Arctia plantaginis]|uniref:Uncharacterized protein n=1 Tax=Arctia plantaginis TaxID=874455 RepID=A0A8S1BKJ6_ARCPL|nr:unnamed protein product [Arctia plantaginis]CAB3260297.1 unnamed protein product [Arctia plantaginis]